MVLDADMVGFRLGTLALRLCVIVVCCALSSGTQRQGRRHVDKVDFDKSSRRQPAGFPAKSLNNTECADLRYGIAYLDNLLSPRVQLAHPPALTQYRYMHLLTEVEAIQADDSYKRKVRRGQPNGLRPDPKMIYGDRLRPRNEINYLLSQINEILHEAKVNMHRVKSRLHHLMQRSPRHLQEDVYNMMRSVYDTRTKARDLIDDMALLPYSLYNTRLLCHQVHGNYSCPLPAIKRTKHLQVLSWTWHHARVDNEYEAARKLFRKVVDMASSNRDQLFKVVRIKHEYFRHNTRRNIREHYRRIHRMTRRLKRVANLLSRLKDRLRIIQRSYKQVNHVLGEYRTLKSTVHKSHSGVNEAQYALRSIHGPIYTQLIQSLPALFDMRYNFMEKRKRVRLAMLYRMDVKINELRDETDWLLGPLNIPMRRASPYTELIVKHFNISTVVKGMGEQLAQAQQNLVEFTELTNKFILTKIKDDKTEEEGSGDVDKEDSTSDHTSPSLIVNNTTRDPTVNVTELVTTEMTTPTTTEKYCAWWDYACKAEKKKTTTPKPTSVSGSTRPSSTVSVKTAEGSTKTTESGNTSAFSTVETTERQKFRTSTPATPTTSTITTTTTEKVTSRPTTSTPKSTETTTEITTAPSSTTTGTTSSQTESETGSVKVTPTQQPKTTTTCGYWDWECWEKQKKDKEEKNKDSTSMAVPTATKTSMTSTQPKRTKTGTEPFFTEAIQELTTSGQTTGGETVTTTDGAQTNGVQLTPTTLPPSTTTCGYWDWDCWERKRKEEEKEDSTTTTTTTALRTTTKISSSTATPTTTEATSTTTPTTTTEPTSTTMPTTTTTTTTTMSTPETTKRKTTTVPTTTTTTATTTQPPTTTTPSTTTTTTTNLITDSEIVEGKVTPTKLPKVTTTCHWWYGCPEEEEVLMDDPSIGFEEEKSEVVKSDDSWWSILTGSSKEKDVDGEEERSKTEAKEAKSEVQMVDDASWWSMFMDSEGGEKDDDEGENKLTITEEVKSAKKSGKMEERMLSDWRWWITDEEEEEEDEAKKETATEEALTTEKTTESTTTFSTVQATTPAITTTTTTTLAANSLSTKSTIPSQMPISLSMTTLKDERTTAAKTPKSKNDLLEVTPDASVVKAFTISPEDDDELIFGKDHLHNTPEPAREVVATKQKTDDSVVFVDPEDCGDSGSGDGDPGSCHPKINESTEAAQYLRQKLHKVQGESYNSLFTAKDMRFLVNETKHRLRVHRRDLYSEIQNFPQDEAAAVHQLVPDVSHLVLPPARMKNLDFKMGFVNKKSQSLQERLSSYVHKLNQTRKRIAEVDRTGKESVPPSVEVAKAREQFSKLVEVDYDIAFRARRIKQMAQTIDWQLATMKRRIQEAENIHKAFTPVVPLNDQTAMSGRVPASLRRPAAVKTVSVMVKTNSATGSLLQFSPLHRTDSETAIDVGIADGKPCAEWSGKRTKKKVLCERPINDGNWHQLHIMRSGNELVLQENSVEDPDNIVSNRTSLPVASMFDPLPRRVQLQPVKHRIRHRGKRHVTPFRACLTNLHVDGTYVVMNTTGSTALAGNLSVDACDIVLMNHTHQLPALPVFKEEKAREKCLPHKKTVVDLTSKYGNLFMISVSFITKERRGAILVYRTSGDDLWVLRLFQGHVLFEGTVGGARFRKLCYSSTPLTGRQWHLFAVTMDNLASSIILDGEMCLSTRMRLLPRPEGGYTNLAVYATQRDLRDVAHQSLPSRTHITRFHGRLRDLMINNRKVTILQEKSCNKKTP